MLPVQRKPKSPDSTSQTDPPARAEGTPIGPTMTWHAPVLERGRLPADARVVDFDPSPLVEMVRFGLDLPSVLRDHPEWQGWGLLYKQWATADHWRAKLRDGFDWTPLIFSEHDVTGALQTTAKIVEVGRGKGGYLLRDSSTSTNAGTTQETSADADATATTWKVGGKASGKVGVGDTGIGVEGGGEIGQTYTTTRTTGRVDGITTGEGAIRGGADETGVFFPVVIELSLYLKLTVKGRPHIDIQKIRTRGSVVIATRDCVLG
jgi:hypothetical protein